jgi:hypothetical protein
MKNLFLVAVLLLTVSALSFAQTSAGVTATVNAVLSVVKTNDLAIGNVTKGTVKTVLSTDAPAAAFTVTGEPATVTDITVAFPANLTFGVNNLPFTGQIPVYNSSNSQVGTTALAGLTSGSATLNGSGNLYLWIGGGVNAAVGQTSGTYSGTINVTVAYP